MEVKKMEKRIKTYLIEEYLKEKNLTKKEFCRLCKMSYPTLQKVLKQDYTVRIGAIFKIAKQMNLYITDLLG